ncbi:unnamed protein product [Sphagnum troendelagicum]|uniref:carotenoid 9,10-dioxygenase n=1 Tax=Sphagnum troendelagicum TaxID=128251 RepID=A0ABP0U4V7_9BRYO
MQGSWNNDDVETSKAMVELSRLQKTATNIRPSPAAAWACDSLERALVKIFAGSDIGGAEHSDHDRKHSSNFFLNGSFEPVAHETSPVSNLPVSGSIPECLNGQFMQVVPNPRFSPVADYHWFDGDGVLHGLNIKNGKATYMARFVRTSKLQQEEYYGAAKFLKIGDMVGIKGILFFLLHLLRIKLGVLDISHGVGTANTALVYHNRKLLALYEGDKPYAIRVLEDGDLETIGQEDYGGKLTNNFTAHPKIDPVTGEMFGMCYDVMASPYLTYQVFSKGGDLMEPVPITLQDSAIMHDFAITENYAIFMDPPVAVNIKNLARGEHVIKFDPSKESRLGLLPRYAQNESQIRWFTIPTCMIIHSANAWEEGDEVVLVLTRRARIDFNAMGTGFQHKKWMDSPSQLYKYRINLKTGQVTQRELSIPVMQTDYPKINEKYLGRRQRYVYGCIFNDTPKVVGVVKYDVSVEPELPPQDLKVGGNISGLFLHGDGRYGSEVFFVPCNTVGKDIQEDDGYLICFVHDEKIGNSEVVIIDAKTMASKPVAVVSLPSRVPAGFHTIFVSEEQLKTQI